MMQFNKNDENYIYEVISRNIKKYRKLKGWTQEKLANEINYSLSFIRGIESNYHQTFSLGALWRISIVLGVDFPKLCEDEANIKKPKYVDYVCNKCNKKLEMPIEVVEHFKTIYQLAGNNEIPSFHCTNCDGKMCSTDVANF